MLSPDCASTNQKPWWWDLDQFLTLEVPGRRSASVYWNCCPIGGKWVNAVASPI
jgi:hypothetical protein